MKDTHPSSLLFLFSFIHFFFFYFVSTSIPPLTSPLPVSLHHQLLSFINSQGLDVHIEDRFLNCQWLEKLINYTKAKKRARKKRAMKAMSSFFDKWERVKEAEEHGEPSSTYLRHIGSKEKGSEEKKNRSKLGAGEGIKLADDNDDNDNDEDGDDEDDEGDAYEELDRLTTFLPGFVQEASRTPSKSTALRRGSSRKKEERQEWEDEEGGENVTQEDEEDRWADMRRRKQDIDTWQIGRIRLNDLRLTLKVMHMLY